MKLSKRSQGETVKLRLYFPIKSCYHGQLPPSGVWSYTKVRLFIQWTYGAPRWRVSDDGVWMLFASVCLRAFVSHWQTSMSSVCAWMFACLQCERSRICCQLEGILKRIWSCSLLLASFGDWTQRPAKPAETHRGAWQLPAQISLTSVTLRLLGVCFHTAPLTHKSRSF